MTPRERRQISARSRRDLAEIAPYRRGRAAHAAARRRSGCPTAGRRHRSRMKRAAREDTVGESCERGGGLPDEGGRTWCVCEGDHATPLTHERCFSAATGSLALSRTSQTLSPWSQWPVAMAAAASETSIDVAARDVERETVHRSAAMSHSRTVPSHPHLRAIRRLGAWASSAHAGSLSGARVGEGGGRPRRAGDRVGMPRQPAHRPERRRRTRRVHNRRLRFGATLRALRPLWRRRGRLGGLGRAISVPHEECSVPPAA